MHVDVVGGDIDVDVDVKVVRVFESLVHGYSYYYYVKVV